MRMFRGGSAVRASQLGLERGFLRLPAYASRGIVAREASPAIRGSLQEQERGFERLECFWKASGERAGAQTFTLQARR